jgi:hypothetical protein
MYILKVILNIVTAATDALVVLGNKILNTCVKEVCGLWAQPHFDTFHQILISVEALWSQPVLQVDKQVVVAQSKIRAERLVVKQLPVEMLQQYPSAKSCMQMRIIMQKHYTLCQHSMPFFLNGLMQCF